MAVCCRRRPPKIYLQKYWQKGQKCQAFRNLCEFSFEINSIFGNLFYAGINAADTQMIRKWLPELSEVADDHLFEPWLAAAAVTYPEPVGEKIVFPLVDLPFLS